MAQENEAELNRLRCNVANLRYALHEARDFIACVDCEEGLTIDNLIELIDKALGTGTVLLPDPPALPSSKKEHENG